MEDVLGMAQKLGASYAEAVVQNVNTNLVEVQDNKLKQMSAGQSKLYALRLIYENKIGLAYSYKADFKELLQRAVTNAKGNQSLTDVAPARQVRKVVKTKVKVNPLDVDIAEKKDYVMGLDVRDKFGKVVNLKLTYMDSVADWEFVNTEGTRLRWLDFSASFVAWAFSKGNGTMQNYFKTLRKKGGYEIMESAKPVVDEAMKKAQDMLTAKAAKGGKFPTIVDGKLGGVFAHEAVGHACEADHVLTNASILTGKMGQKIASEKLSISDDGSLKEWGWTPFDAEGVGARKTRLIKDGVLVGWLHSRETAQKFSESLTGNGRSQTVAQRVIPRMTNTFIEKGDSTFDEMIAEVKKGYYLKGSLGGQVDPIGGEFLFNAQEGYYVENGEVKHMVRGVSLTGSILKTMHNIKLVGDDMHFGFGFCGKAGQSVPVSEGGPHVLIDDATVGGSR
jgi:TldD protein